jgi:hypothetical protein
MSENYNSAGSPYWAFKAFLPLALPETHPFWTAEEKSPENEPAIIQQKHPGMVLMRSRDDVVALSSGQENQQMRFGAEKYSKFAYSARYGFSIESDERIFAGGAFDSMLAFSDDGLHYRVRETNQEAKLAGDTLYAKWSPYPDVTVETWLVPASPWHIRLHRINTPRPLQTAEGGFAIARRDFEADTLSSATGAAYAIGEEDFSGILDLGSTITREGIAQKAPPNTNLIVSKTLVPQLRGTIPAGETILVSAVLAAKDPSAVQHAWSRPPAKPDIDALRALVKDQGVTVSAIKAPGRLP